MPQFMITVTLQFFLIDVHLPDRKLCPFNCFQFSGWRNSTQMSWNGAEWHETWCQYSQCHSWIVLQWLFSSLCKTCMGKLNCLISEEHTHNQRGMLCFYVFVYFLTTVYILLGLLYKLNYLTYSDRTQTLWSLSKTWKHTHKSNNKQTKGAHSKVCLSLLEDREEGRLLPEMQRESCQNATATLLWSG